MLDSTDFFNPSSPGPGVGRPLPGPRECHAAPAKTERRRIDPEDVRRLAATCTQAEIARQLGCWGSSIRRILNRLGIKAVIDRVDVEYVRRLASEGYSSKEIAAKVNRSHHTIRHLKYAQIIRDINDIHSTVFRAPAEFWKENDEKFCQLVANGASATEAARALGTTKNACISRARRTGLVWERSPDWKLPARPIFTLPNHDECSWPIGDVGDPDFHFCGAPAVRGKSYCAEHCAKGHVKPRTSVEGLAAVVR